MGSRKSASTPRQAAGHRRRSAPVPWRWVVLAIAGGLLAAVAVVAGVVYLLANLSAASLPALPQAPVSGWKAYSEDAAKVTLHLPSTWRIVDAAHTPAQSDIDTLKAAGDPMGNYLSTMSAAVQSGIYKMEAVDPTTVSADVPFATSAYLVYVPGQAKGQKPSDLLTQNLSATRANYKLSANPAAKAVRPPDGFDHAWEISYTWTATRNNGTEQASVDGLHYLLLRGDDAWILGFTTMADRGTAVLPTWRQIAGSISAR